MEIKMKKILLTSALLLSLGSAQAAQAPRWDSVSASYQSVDVESQTFTGFGIAGSKLLDDNFFVTAGYRSVSDDIRVSNESVEVDLNALSVGLGYRQPISQNTDVFGVVSYEDMEVEGSYQGYSQSNSDNGYGLQVGVRSMLTEQFELGASLQYIDIADDSATAFAVSALYNFTEQFSAGIGFSKGEDMDAFSVSGVYFF
jgi:opacity protein-like surface antigen